MLIISLYKKSTRPLVEGSADLVVQPGFGTIQDIGILGQPGVLIDKKKKKKRRGRRPYKNSKR